MHIGHELDTELRCGGRTTPSSMTRGSPAAAGAMRVHHQRLAQARSGLVSGSVHARCEVSATSCATTSPTTWEGGCARMCHRRLLACVSPSAARCFTSATLQSASATSAAVGSLGAKLWALSAASTLTYERHLWCQAVSAPPRQDDELDAMYRFPGCTCDDGMQHLTDSWLRESRGSLASLWCCRQPMSIGDRACIPC